MKVEDVVQNLGTDSRLPLKLVLLSALWLSPLSVPAQQPAIGPPALPKPTPPTIKPRSEERDLALLLVAGIANDLKSATDKPAAALIQAEAADTLWEFDEIQARSLFRLAFDTARQQIPETSNLDDNERAKRLDMLRRQALAITEIIRMFGRHDRISAERWQEALNEEQKKGETTPTQPSQERAEFLAQLALQEVDTNPKMAEQFGLMSLAGSEIPSAFGPLLIALSEVDRALSDVLFRAAIAVLSKNVPPNGSILSALSNYLFFSDGRIFSRTDMSNGRLLVDYLIAAANSQVLLLRDARSKGVGILPETVAFTNFLAIRGLPIIENNAREKLPIVRPLLNELSSGLSAQQLSDLNVMSANVRRQNRMDPEPGVDLETLIDRVEREKDAQVRDYQFRLLAIGAMRGDPDRALKFAARIGDESMRYQTEDDINLAIIGDTVRSAGFQDARQAAFKFHDPNLRAKSLAEIADRALSVSSDRELAADLLLEAFAVASKGEVTVDRAAIILLLAQKFANFDQARGFEMLTTAISTINKLNSQPAIPARQSQRRGPRIVSYTMVGGAELSTEESSTLDSLAFTALRQLGKADYYRARNLGDDIKSTLMRSRYLLTLARGILDIPEPKQSRRSALRRPQ